MTSLSVQYFVVQANYFFYIKGTVVYLGSGKGRKFEDFFDSLIQVVKRVFEQSADCGFIINMPGFDNQGPDKKNINILKSSRKD